jgi:hypothetical protein
MTRKDAADLQAEIRNGLWGESDRRQAQLDRLEAECDSRAAEKAGQWERSEDGSTWTVESEDVVARRLRNCYIEVPSLMRLAAADGRQIRTMFAFYRFVPGQSKSEPLTASEKLAHLFRL